MTEQSVIQEDEVIVDTEPFLVRFTESPTDVLCNDCGMGNASAIEVSTKEIIDVVCSSIEITSQLGKRVALELQKQRKHHVGICTDCALNASLMEGPVA
ncbi:hypothetical protein HY627_01735 [Candidatus Uhrbacteria bacterium]|nr:hypothetical protein [Candidatus Uhrbacteria bacterium]